MNSSTMQWYALTVQARTVQTTSLALRGKGFEEYLPVFRERRRWSDRTKTVDSPLFPGYIFCRFDPFDRLIPVLTTPGVTGIVSAGRTPIPVSGSELESVRAVVASGLPAHPWPHVGVGSKVSITRGPLAGLEGVISCADKVDRFIVSVSLLQRSVAVEIDRDWAVPAERQPGNLLDRSVPLRTFING